VPLIKSHCGSTFLTVTPGIRLSTNAPDDQCRVTTPEMAINLGSDYLVIGRPITRAAHPQQVVADLLQLRAAK
jgi:orotidine-5'-phosphate decarboxylase